MKFNTKLLHNITRSIFAQREILPPISQVNAFKYDKMEELEGGIGSVSCNSGMSAIAISLLAVCNSGDEIIAGSGLYGGTISLFHDFEKLGIHTILLEDMRAENVKNFISDKTKVIFSELISFLSTQPQRHRLSQDRLNLGRTLLFIQPRNTLTAEETQSEELSSTAANSLGILINTRRFQSSGNTVRWHFP